MGLRLNRFFNLVNLQGYNITQLLRRRIALVFLNKFIRGILNLVADGNLALRPAYNTAIFGYRLKNALTNPPDSVRDKLESACLIKLVGCSDKAKITFINQVREGNALMLILLGDGNNETKIRCHQFFLCFFSFLSSLPDYLGEFDLLIRSDHRHTAYLYKVSVE